MSSKPTPSPDHDKENLNLNLTTDKSHKAPNSKLLTDKITHKKAQAVSLSHQLAAQEAALLLAKKVLLSQITADRQRQLASQAVETSDATTRRKKATHTPAPSGLGPQIPKTVKPETPTKHAYGNPNSNNTSTGANTSPPAAPPRGAHTTLGHAQAPAREKMDHLTSNLNLNGRSSTPNGLANGDFAVKVAQPRGRQQGRPTKSSSQARDLKDTHQLAQYLATNPQLGEQEKAIFAVGEFHLRS